MQRTGSATNILLTSALDVNRASYLNSVKNWAGAVSGEGREALIQRIMDAFDKSVNARLGEEVLLNLNLNRISTCPPLFRGLTHLKLEAVPLTSWPDHLPDTIIHLVMKNCAWLTALPDNLSSQLPQLNYLDLYGTPITVLPVNQLASLEYLRITGCENLEELPHDFLDQMPQLKQFLTANSCMARWVFYQQSERIGVEKRIKAIQFGPCYKQTYPRSCGAASLLSIAVELGVKQLPLLTGSRSKVENRDQLALDTRCESDLYVITSGHQGEYSELSLARGSLPHNIIRAGKLLGLTEKLYVPENIYTEAMKNDSTLPDVEVLSINESIAINKEVTPPLMDGELEIKFLVEMDSSGNPVQGLWDEVTHCIVVRPDGSCMDPAYGENFHTISDLMTNYDEDVETYVDSGMSIVFKRDLM